MNKTFNLLFYLKKSKKNKQGQSPIYLRITVDGKRAEISTKRYVEPAKWNNEAQKLNGRKEHVVEVNTYLDTIKAKAYQAQRELLQDDKDLTAQAIKNRMLGTDQKQRMLIPIFEHHNKQMEKLIGKEYAKGTHKRFETTLKHLKDFLRIEYKSDDIDIKKLDHQFVTDLEYYFKSKRNCAHNTTMKYITNIKKVVRITLANGWISRDPFMNYNITLKEVDREFLTKDELQNLYSKELHTKRLDQVRDIFVFCCFTGLAYIDVKRLTNDKIVLGMDGEKWIKTNRTKSKSLSRIPLLPTALEILDKYKNHPEAVHDNVLLPVLSNQKSNAYLKEIADLCKINKNLTTHLARHTFATTVTLSNGIPIETVSKMLGHKTLKTTQHYAKIVDRKISEDMSILKNKMDLKKQKTG